MTPTVLRYSLVIAALVLGLAPKVSRAQGHQPKTPQSELCGTVQNPCLGLTVGAQPVTDTVQSERSGSYPVEISNPTTVTATIALICHEKSTQLPCTGGGDIFATYQVGSGQAMNVSVPYSTLGIGKFQQVIVGINQTPPEDGKVYRTQDSTIVSWVTVIGLPIGQITAPVNGALVGPTDTIRAQFAHPSGLDSMSFKLYVDGADYSSYAHRTAMTIYAVGLPIANATHTVQGYGCALTGRCDMTSTISFVQAGPPPVWALDDSLPPVDGKDGTYSGTLPGALPLPLSGQRGCPVSANYPEIRLTSPNSYFSQPAFGTNPTGFIFLATVNWDTVLSVTTTDHDYTANQNVTCASYTYLGPSQYNWNFWTIPETPQSDSIWAVYPFGDCSGCGIRPASGSLGSVVAADVTAPSVAGGATTSRRGGARIGEVTPLINNPGGIDPNSFQLTLNGTLIVTGSTPVPAYATWVHLISSDGVGQQFQISASLPILHRFDPLAPTADNGGWNEMIASIADTGERSTSIRARFVQVKPPVISDVNLAAARDFSKLDQGECAAFGTFQCGGVMVVHPIPGFITRDKDRSLHLVYRSASQRGPMILPLNMTMSAFQATPDSFWAVPLVGGVASGDTLRYYGLSKPAGAGANEPILWRFTTQTRVIGTQLNALATGDVAVRSVSTQVRALYGSTPHDNQLTQEVVQLYLSDTVSARFGPGWNLAEHSRLLLGQTSQGAPAMMWVGGDGSYSIFRQVGGVWVSPPGETAKLYDSLTTAGLTDRYVVMLDNGASVGYTATGWLHYVTDLVGNRTTFGYQGNRLIQINDPTGLYYELQYNDPTGAPGLVTDIVMHGVGGVTGRIASFAYNAQRQLRQIKIWRSATQGDSTRFGYLTGAPGAYLDSIVDPRSTQSTPIVTTFDYDPLVFTPMAEHVPPYRGVSMVALFRDTWRRAVPRAGRGRAGQVAERIVSPSQARGTFVDVANQPTDFRVDKFGGPTLVQVIAPQAVNVAKPDQVPLFRGFGGDDVRRITRDSLGRVTKIVQAPDSSAITDSVFFHYDRLGRVDTLVRVTRAYPIPTNPQLDTTTFRYDSALVSGMRWCSRLLATRDPLGGRDSVDYAGASGAAACLPAKAIGLGGDTTRFTYGPLTAGDAAGVRPVSITDPAGVMVSMQYNTTLWNSSVSTRAAANDISRAFYDAFGRADSTLDGAGTRAYSQKDLSGRVLFAKVGRGALAPTTATLYNASGLVDSVRVYASDDEVLGTQSPPSGPVQTTRYFYNLLGWLDSTITPGGRRQTFIRENHGNPVFEYTANGAYILRLYDWRGRLHAESQSSVGPDVSINGDPFADPAITTAYRNLGLAPGWTLSVGQTHQLDYTNKGQLSGMSSRDLVAGDLFNRQYGYSRTGLVVADTVHFVSGATVIRTYEYNRRGQRTRASTAISAVTVGEPKDTTNYFYTTATARLDSMVQTAYTPSPIVVGRVRWQYDLAGRDTLRGVLLGGAVMPNELRTHFSYEAAGRLSLLRTENPGGAAPGTWYQFSAPSYSAIDELLAYTAVEPSGTGPSQAVTRGYTYTYAPDGTRRLTHEATTLNSVGERSRDWTYDVFGNRLTELPWTSSSPAGCAQISQNVSTYGTDNQLVRGVIAACQQTMAYLNDRAGSRLVEYDTTQGTSPGPAGILSYTAKNQLFFSMTPSQNSVYMYDYNWHYYDATGLRVITHVQNGSTWVPQGTVKADSGTRSYYVYDGSDVALTLVRFGGGTWWVRARYLTGGLDQPLAGRFSTAGGTGTENLALVLDRTGSTLAAVKVDGTLEQQSVYYNRDSYGNGVQSQSGPGAIKTETGFTGASAPNATGGFVYLRNRWYDPKTGRFLTQDPIGLAGGINLYSYAGNDPVAFDDPFGLCKDKDGKERKCRVEISPDGKALGAKFEDLTPETVQKLQTIADDANRDLGINATTNGSHTDWRHSTGEAADIGFLDNRDIGHQATTNPGMRDVAAGVQAVMGRLSGELRVAVNLGPAGRYTGASGPVPIADPDLRAAHANHIHVSFNRGRGQPTFWDSTNRMVRGILFP